MAKPKPERFANSKTFYQALAAFEEEFPRIPILYPLIRFILSIFAEIVPDVPIEDMRGMSDQDIEKLLSEED